MALGKLGGGDGGEGADVMAEINITPLTDIFLVLLIIFMITQSALVESAAKVNLPKATQTTQESRGVTVTVTKDERIFVNQLPVDEAQLQGTLQDLLADDPRKLVILQGDRSVMLGEAVRLMDIAKRAGAQAISISAEKEESPAGSAPAVPSAAPAAPAQ
ncbi:MAG: biopolymer transport protein ExbD [Candidatus Binatota bacterium]|jgi:biopolymer transport protein ExbD|nr:biopolymer transport protein ExbD [Candidatus Binatota bacterium]